jgi:diadenosine tetraphosphate (Ap4A) HIT family hydrolase
MKREITDIQGNKIHTDCLGCARERGEIITGTLTTTEYFDAHQDFEIPIPGFIIISSRRHLKSVDEFTEEEQADFIKILTTVRRTMRSSLGIDAVYLVQEEDTSHHFHLWLFPRQEWMIPFGRKIQSVRPIMEHAREHMKTAENLKLVNEAIEKMKSTLGN